jgi:hypothetical protein
MEEFHASFNIDIFSADERVSQPSRPRVSFYRPRGYISDTLSYFPPDLARVQCTLS